MLERVQASKMPAQRASAFGDWTGFVGETLTIGERRGLGLIELAAFERGEAVRGALSAQLGLALPAAGASAEAGEIAALSTGPERWLLVAPESALAALPAPPRDQAAITDLTGGRSILTLTGAAAVCTLRKGTAVDLDPAVFISGSVAATALARMPAIIWRRGGGYDLIVPRSYAVTMRDWLLVASSV